MRRFRGLFRLIALITIAIGVASLLRSPRERAVERPELLDALMPDTPTASPPFAHPQDEEWFDSAAIRAWRYVDSATEPRTGLVRTVTDYPVATAWDIGSTLAALHSAHELGLLTAADFDRRTATLLNTLNRIELFDRTAFNKTYSTASGRMLGRDDAPSTRGFGWSALDLGRLLIWLRIIADHHPAHSASAAAVAARLDFDRLVAGGHILGEDLDRRGRPRTYPEGTLAYEQYAARGFALWGHEAPEALSFTANAEPLRLWNETILVDRRPRACITSEPLVLLGLELGWNDAARRLSLSALRAQQARFLRTGRVTIASEDASTVAPHYFFYYCIHGDGLPFRLMTAGHIPISDGPRTVSAKAALAWFALVPDPYTRTAVEHVMTAWHDAGPELIAGVDEETGLAVGPANINTAAVVLEAALYRRRGGPIGERQGLQARRETGAGQPPAPFLPRPVPE